MEQASVAQDVVCHSAVIQRAVSGPPSGQPPETFLTHLSQRRWLSAVVTRYPTTDREAAVHITTHSSLSSAHASLQVRDHCMSQM